MSGFALLVGLTHVDSVAYNGWDGTSGCWGCEKDVKNMKEMLQKKGFHSFNIQILLNEAATAESILEKLNFFSEITEKDDNFVFYYSGHGGQLADSDDEEPDGKDETLIAYNRQLIDDELRLLWPKFSAKVISIFDSCHSGSANRSKPQNSAKKISRSARMNNSKVNFLKSKSFTKARENDEIPEKIHIGACRDEQTSIGTRRGGLFTLALVESINNGFKESYQKLTEHINSVVRGQRAVATGDKALLQTPAFQLAQGFRDNEKTIHIKDIKKIVAILTAADVSEIGGTAVADLPNARPVVDVKIRVSW